MINSNAVYKNDHDSSSYMTTIRTIPYYLIIFYWELDHVVHNLFVVVCYLENWVLVRVNGRSIIMETMAAMIFKLSFPFLWSPLQLCSNGMARQNVHIGCVTHSLWFVIAECVIFSLTYWPMVLDWRKRRDMW